MFAGRSGEQFVQLGDSGSNGFEFTEKGMLLIPHRPQPLLHAAPSLPPLRQFVEGEECAGGVHGIGGSSAAPGI